MVVVELVMVVMLVVVMDGWVVVELVVVAMVMMVVVVMDGWVVGWADLSGCGHPLTVLRVHVSECSDLSLQPKSPE